MVAYRYNEVVKVKETVTTKDQEYKNVYLDYFRKWKKNTTTKLYKQTKTVSTPNLK